jgi:hypothetical protein
MQFKVPFDDHLKEQLGDYRPAVPDHIWENVKQKKDKKRPFFFFLRDPNFIIILLSIVATGSLIGYLLFQSSNNETAFANQTHSIQQRKFISNSTVTNEFAISQNKVNSNNSTFNDKALKEVSIEENDSNKKVLGNKVGSQLTQTSENNNPQIHQQAEQNNFTKKQHTSIKSRTSFSISQPTIDEDVNINEIFTDAQFSNESQLFSSPQAVDLISLKHAAIPEFKTPLKINLNIPCPDDNKNPAANKKYVEVYAAADYVLRQFSDTPNSTYMRMRKESTSFASAYSTGIRFTKVFNNGFNIRAGLNYSQINEKFKFVQGNIIQVVFIINATGDTIGSYQTSSTRYKTSFNHYKTLDIPVTIGYETSRGKWNVNFNTGLIVNIHSWNQGEVLNDSLQPVNISGLSHNPYQFKTNIGIGGIGAISCYYSLNEKLSILAEPYLRYNFSSMSKEEITLKQKYHTSGIKLGIRLNL